MPRRQMSLPRAIPSEDVQDPDVNDYAPISAKEMFEACGPEVRRPPLAPSTRVEPVPVDATPFVTVAESDPIWEERLGNSGWSDWFESLRGKFVRLRPPSSCSPEVVSFVREGVAAVAIAVKFVPAQKDEVVPAVEREHSPARSSVREVVAKLVEVANVPDRSKLAAVIDGALSRAGV